MSQENLEKSELNFKREEYVSQLGATLGCVIVQQPGMPGMMYVEFEPPVIEGPTIETQNDFAIMLHELGHVEYGHTQGRPPHHDKTYYFDNGVLRSESEAWEYALDHLEVNEKIENETRLFMWRTCLGSYYTHYVIAAGRDCQQITNGDRDYVRFRFDEPDEYFWSIKARILDKTIEEAKIGHHGPFTEAGARSSRTSPIPVL